MFRRLGFLAVLVGLLALSLGARAQQDESSTASWPSFDDFMHWIKEHGKAYKSHELLMNKYKAFVNNHFLVQDMNRQYKGKTEFKLNQFADMSPDEFKATVLMRPRDAGRIFERESTPDRFLQPFEGGESELPDSFDWRTQGAVTPVKDQGSVGTCWAFSTVQNLEGLYKLKGNPLTNLSVEQVVDCDGTFNATTDQGDCGVFGGWPFMALQYVERQGGIESEADYAYCAGNKNPCFPCEPPGYNKTNCGPPVPYCKLKDSCQAKLDPSKFISNLKVVDWKRTSTNETDIAAQLMSVGPLSVALNAQMLQFYHRGIFDPIYCDPAALDHAVLLVGWGVNKSRIHGSQAYWLVKNSWGPKWGEDGYFRILRNKGKCGINTQVVTGILA